MTAKNDMFLRARAEYLDCVRDGGCALFLTFTYSEENVPYRYFSLDDDGFISLSKCKRVGLEYPSQLMVFDKTHIQLMLKRLRKEFSKLFDLSKVDPTLEHSDPQRFKSETERYESERALNAGSLRYICVSEYGSHRTQRPHYHVIFYLSGELFRRLYPDKVPSNDDICLCSDLTQFFADFWDYGMVSASTKGLFVDSDACASYVSKYVCKNIDLLKFTRFKNFFDFICDAFYAKDFSPSRRDFESALSFDEKSHRFQFGFVHPSDLADTLSCVPEVPRIGRLAVPFGKNFKSPMSFFLYYCRLFDCNFYVCKSQNFGLSLVDSLPKDDPELFCKAVDRGIAIYSRKSSDIRYYRIPRYIVNKILYNHRDDGSYYLNEFGLKTVDYMRLNTLSKSVEFVHSFDFSLLDTVPVNLFDSLYEKYTFLRGHSLNELVDYLRNYTAEVFAFDMFLRGRAFDTISFRLACKKFIRFVDGEYFSFLDFCRSMDSLVIDFAPSVVSLPKDSPTSFDYLSRFGDFNRFTSRFEFNHTYHFFEHEFRWASYLAAVSDFWRVLSTYCRGCLLNEYRIQSEETKRLADILNFNKYLNYGFQKKCS